MPRSALQAGESKGPWLSPHQLGGGAGARPERAADAVVGRYSGERGVQPRCATPKGSAGEGGCLFHSLTLL